MRILEGWMKSYRPGGTVRRPGPAEPELAELAPTGTQRMGANPHANGGLLLRDLDLPDFREYAVEVPGPGAAMAESTRVQGKFLRDVMKGNLDGRTSGCSARTRTTRTAGRTCSTRRTAATRPKSTPSDDHLAPDGRVMEVLSEHQCQGWLEGYLLTGRHGFFSCYEAFIHIVDSMFNQHAKWLKVCRHIPWRRPIA